MAVNKIFPRTLSKSKDARFRKKTEMVDALNVRASETLDAFISSGDIENSIDDSGNGGVIKPVLGNNLVEVIESDLGGQGRDSSYSVIGSVSDEARGHVYYFMYHINPDLHSVYMYSDELGSIQLVYRSSLFNFRYGSVVQGEVAHVSSSTYGQGIGEKTFLYFTDNHNEPRCLDVITCLRGDALGYTDSEVQQFISMCPIAPTQPIQCQWGYDALRPTSNFINNRGLQFAYQNVYNNGTVSAFSVYSKLAVNPGYLTQGASSSAELDVYNYISVRIPVQNKNVSSIKLYAREGNDGAWFYIDDFRQGDVAAETNWTGPYQGFYAEINGEPAVPFFYNAFRFYNDSVISYVPEDITFKQFDSVPKLAEAIAISNDRVFMGNYVEGFDKPEIDASLTYVPIERPDDFSTLDLVVKPEVRVITQQPGCNNRVAGYRVSMHNAPETFEANSTLNLSIVVNPDNNIHLYQSKDSFHSSSFVTFNDPSDTTLLRDKVRGFADEDLETLQSSLLFSPTAQAFGQVSYQNVVFGGLNMQKADLGFDPIASADETYQNQASAVWKFGNGESKEVAYGTSASNPLILQGKQISFYVRLDINSATPRSHVSDCIAAVLSGKTLTVPRDGVVPGLDEFISTSISLIDVKATSEYQVDCGLNDESYISLSDSNSRRVCFVVDRGFAETNPKGIPPCGYFIVNKADLEFGLINVTAPNIFDPNRKYGANTFAGGEDGSAAELQTDDIFFALDLLSVSNPQVMTCLPDIDGGYQPSGNVGVATAIHDHTDLLYTAQAPHLLNQVNVSANDVYEFSKDEIKSNIERSAHIVKGWTVLSRGSVGSVHNNPGQLPNKISGITSEATREDLQRIANGNFLGGQFKHYTDRFFQLDETEFDPGFEYSLLTAQNDPEGNHNYDDFPIVPLDLVHFVSDPDFVIAYQNFLQTDLAVVGSTQAVVQWFGNQGFTISNPSQVTQGTLLEGAFTTNNPAFVTGTSPIIIQQLRCLVGYLNLPGRSEGDPNDPITSDEGRPFEPTSTGGLGSLVPTRRRIIEEINSQFEGNFSEVSSGQNLLSGVLGFTLVDGEAGPGSNTKVGSVNSTTIRDGILYYTYGAGFADQRQTSPTEQTNGTFYNEHDSTAFAQLAPGYSYYPLNAEFYGVPPVIVPRSVTTGDTNAVGQFIGRGQRHDTADQVAFPTAGQLAQGVRTGFFCNPFEYYMAYAEDSYINASQGITGTTYGNGSFQVDSFQEFPWNQQIDIYDGQTEKYVLNHGADNVNYAEFYASDVALDSIFQSNIYRLTNINAWYRQLIPHVEISSQISFIQISGDQADRKSFKTNATHAFGIVYSDFYGRQSTVYPLGSTFVPPYELQQDIQGGAVDIAIRLDHEPPTWAHSYQIVYGGNCSYDRFIQYSAGGGFVPEQIDTPVLSVLGQQAEGNIYVSLNYLQHNSDVSYAKAFGARTPDGSDVFYEYRPGDRLRIISYYEGGQRFFANNIIFDVVGTAILGDNDDNPLHPASLGTAVPKHLQGSFVILRNNPSAAGFDAASIVQGGGNGQTNQFSLWNNRCIIEISTPSTVGDIEDRPYREIGESYRVVRVSNPANPNGYTREHEYNPIRIKDGDVYFRRHAVNFASNGPNGFVNLINETDASTPGFYNYYLESSTFNDRVLGADQHNYGRIKVVSPNASEIRRYSSIIFSDQDDYTDAILRLNSFDATKQPYKDIPNSYGNISCLVDFNEGLFVLQQTKASSIPVNRTIVSEASGSELILATSKVLGTQRYYAGESGCDTNPESVALYGNTVFWANKKKGEVYRFTPSRGVQKISDAGMKTYFRKMFEELNRVALNQFRTKVRVVGGYDLIHDEYVLSAYNEELFDFTPDVSVDQDIVPISDLEGDEFVDLTDTIGDLTTEQEEALVIQVEELQSQLAQNQTLIQGLNGQILELISTISSATSNNDNNTVPDSIQDLLDQLSELQADVQIIDETVRADLERQEQEHLRILNSAKRLQEDAIEAIGLFGYTFQGFTDLGSAILDFFNIETLINPLANVYTYGSQEGLNGATLSIAIARDITNLEKIIQAYDDTIAYFPLYSPLLDELPPGTIPGTLPPEIAIAYTVGYGAGPNPPDDSLVGAQLLFDAGAGGADLALIGVPELQVDSVIYFGFDDEASSDDFIDGLAGDTDEQTTIEIPALYNLVANNFLPSIDGFLNSFVLDTVSIVTSQQSGLEDFKNNLLDQIVALSKGIMNTSVPDIEHPALEEIETFNPNSIESSSTVDFTNIRSSAVADGVLLGNAIFSAAKESYNLAKEIQDLHNEPGGMQLVEDLLKEQSFTQFGVETLIEKGILNSAIKPAVDRLQAFPEFVEQQVAVRNALAYYLTSITSSLQGVSDGQMLSVFIDAGVSPELAQVLASNYGASPSAAYEALRQQLDSNNDQQISIDEVLLNGELLAIEQGFAQLFNTYLGGESDDSGPGAWSALSGIFEKLIDDVLDLSSAMGLENQTSVDVDQGFDLEGIGLLDTIRTAMTAPQWAEGNVSYIESIADTVSRRISDGTDSNRGDLIGIFTQLKEKFESMSFILNAGGYNSSYSINSPNLVDDLRNSIYTNTWNDVAQATASDLEEAIQLLQDFQNLFAADRSASVNLNLSIKENGSEATIGPPSNIPESFTAYGLNTVRPKNILSGQSIEVNPTDQTQFTVSGPTIIQSGFYGLSTVLSRVNESIKQLTANPELLGPFIRSLNGSPLQYIFASYPAPHQNLRAIMPGDVNNDLVSSYQIGTYSGEEVSSIVRNVINPNSSQYYNPGFAEFVRSNILAPQDQISQSQTSAAFGDLDGDGFVSSTDLLAFLPNYGANVPEDLAFVLDDNATVALQRLNTTLVAPSGVGNPYLLDVDDAPPPDFI